MRACRPHIPVHSFTAAAIGESSTLIKDPTANGPVVPVAAVRFLHPVELG